MRALRRVLRFLLHLAELWTAAFLLGRVVGALIFRWRYRPL